MSEKESSKMATQQLKSISAFNNNDTTIFLRKLLDIRESGMRITVPPKWRENVFEPTKRETHYALTRLLIRFHLLPPSQKLTPEMKALTGEIKRCGPGGVCELLHDSSFWPIALSVNRGSSSIYTWEHFLYRDVLDEYLRGLQTLFFECDLYLKNFETALNYIPSLHYFTVPIRFWVGPRKEGEKTFPSEIYGNESILMDYIQTAHPLLWERFTGPDNSDEPRDYVNTIHPDLIEEQIYTYVKIDDEQERKIIHDPAYDIDETFDDVEIPIYWWFPSAVNSFLDNAVRESKLSVIEKAEEGDFEDLDDG